MSPRINYINQLNTFFKIAASLGLTATERALYQAFLHKNSSLYWSESFTTPASEILGLSGLSQSAMQRSRKKLIDAGLIIYKNRGSNRAPRYSVPELSDDYVLTILNDTSNNKVNNTPVNTPNNSVNNTSNTLNKLDKTKLNEIKKNDDYDESPLRFANRCWGNNRPLNSVLQDTILKWCQIWPNDMVCYALELAYKYSVDVNGVKPYVNKIFTEWDKQSAHTLEGAKKLSKPENSYRQKINYNTNHRKEQLPDHIAHPKTEEEVCAEARQKLIDMGVALND